MHMAGMYGDFQGHVAGLPTIPELDFPLLEAGEDAKALRVESHV